MQAHYGYQDGSGRYYITIDTDRCTGCEDCLPACPAGLLEMVEEDPLEERLVAAVGQQHRNRLRDACAPCKAGDRDALPCVAACEPDAIVHSW
jgi:Fe-S-cluster-containing hydrogenase component 2